jgi:hypothetical protein
MRAPLAVVVIGGLLSSTLLTLVMIPAVYTIVDDARNSVAGTAARAIGRRGRPVAVLPIRPTGLGGHQPRASA